MPADKRQRFLQIDSIILDVCGQTCPNYPKWKVCYFPAILEKEVRNEVDFLHVDNHESMLQIDTMILMGMVKQSQISENSKFAMSLQYLKKEVRDDIDSLNVYKHQRFQQVPFSTLVIKASYKVILPLLMGMIKHSQSTQSNKLVISLQYL